MLYTKEQVSQNIRNRQGQRVFYLGKEDHLTSEARDYLNSQRIQILPASEAAPEGYRLLSGAILTEKPEHMTHLNAEVLVPKTHPRICFRGAVDTLEAWLLSCQQAVPSCQKELQEILELTRKLIRCDVLNEPVGSYTLCGLTKEELRQHSHFPQRHYGIPHFMPSCHDRASVLELNRVRCMARAAELAATQAFCDRDGEPTRVDILQALNRISSMLYLLMIREKARPL